MSYYTSMCNDTGDLASEGLPQYCCELLTVAITLH